MSKSLAKKLIIVAILIIAAILFRVLNLGQYFTLEYLKSSQANFAAMYPDNRIMVLAGYMVIYILVTAFSLPGAAVLTLAGGAMFGLVVGVITVSFASSIGATLACFVSRFVLRDWVQNKFGDRLRLINEGVEKEGAFYLFTLRLVPIFPFFVINLVMGLTGMSLFTFYWVSQVGMLAGTIVYVNAGKELAKINSLSGILSPRLIISFVILGLFPIIMKKLLSRYRGRIGRQANLGKG
ncbi:MAG: TVP38/TMEM64 family protein [Deltaproteobacteria bacterium]|nr:TVP38/TMEM64 family protein [Deltaproteobacteria bacterium]